MKKFIVPLAIFAAIGGLLMYALYLSMNGDYSPRDIPSPLIGKSLPAFTLTTVSDPARKVSRDDMRGRVYLLNVWASWCVACRQEHPFLNEISKRKIVPIIGLDYKDERNAALQWLSSMGNPYELSLTDQDGRLGIDLGVYGVPETFVIDKEGVIRYKQIGPITPEAWEKKIAPLLKELS
ncbi:MAG: DsbE family thiol:disulfide interchange protein [Gammaproteobacteria bacterium]|nr:DsbE family thiol:disulfide interchange protein [Gammaproteobacteria bacterium]